MSVELWATVPKRGRGERRVLELTEDSLHVRSAGRVQCPLFLGVQQLLQGRKRGCEVPPFFVSGRRCLVIFVWGSQHPQILRLRGKVAGHGGSGFVGSLRPSSGLRRLVCLEFQEGRQRCRR